jgi:hypothetical protein
LASTGKPAEKKKSNMGQQQAKLPFFVANKRVLKPPGNRHPGVRAMEAMHREFKTSEKMKMVVEGWEGMHQPKCPIKCNFAEMHLQLRTTRRRSGRTPPQGNASEKDATSSAEARIGGQRAGMPKTLGQNG